MSRRTFEGPMDWEYQSTGPVDASSPFAKISQAPRASTFDQSPSKFGQTARNPFASPVRPMPSSTQSKPLPPAPPHSNFFNPKLQPHVQSKFSAPAFRNPAFTTPQKRIDELQFSEMSGAETSPALTEDSEMPDDTPEADRTEDFGRMTITPATANRKLFGGGATGTGKARSRTPGKGELTRGNRDVYLRGKIRKRTRQTGDRDVGSVRPRLPHESDESDSDWEQDTSGKSKPRRHKKKTGAIAGFLGAITSNPNAPMILSRWVQLLVNVFLVGGLLWVIWSSISMMRSDLANATEKARAEVLAEMQICTHEYAKNRCSPKAERLPALGKVCDEWEACMNQDPSSVMRVQVSARNVAEILNEFSSALNLKAWCFVLSTVVVALLANNIGFNRYRDSADGPVHHQPQPAFPSQPAAPPMLAHDPSQAYIWAPINQTPHHFRRGFLAANDDATDTDNSPDQIRAIMPPQTPSARRSPSKIERERERERGRSPTKSRAW